MRANWGNRGHQHNVYCSIHFAAAGIRAGPRRVSYYARHSNLGPVHRHFSIFLQFFLHDWNLCHGALKK